jgi:hypothetical protein
VLEPGSGSIEKAIFSSTGGGGGGVVPGFFLQLPTTSPKHTKVVRK